MTTCVQVHQQRQGGEDVPVSPGAEAGQGGQGQSGGGGGQVRRVGKRINKQKSLRLILDKIHYVAQG